MQLEPIAAFFTKCSHAAGQRDRGGWRSGVRKEARGTMADGAPACECGEPDNDDVMIACSRSHAKCETAKCGGALWFHLHCVGLHEAPAGRWLCSGCEAAAEAERQRKVAEKQKKQDEKERRAAENRAAIQARAEARVEAQAVAAANRQAAAEAKSEAKIKQKVEETIERDLIRPLEKAYNQVVKREVQALLTSMKHTLCLGSRLAWRLETT